MAERDAAKAELKRDKLKKEVDARTQASEQNMKEVNS
jgi:hypothetical protein